MTNPDPCSRSLPTRRRLLGGALLLPALASSRAAALSTRQETTPKPDAPEKGSPAYANPSDELQAFYRRWMPRARELVSASDPQEDAFVYQLCAELVSHPPSFFPKRRLTVYSGGGMETGPAGGDDVFQLVEVVLEPGVTLPAHNHVGYAFVTLCLEGEARVRHFEPEPGSPGSDQLEQDFIVREVQNVLLRPGTFSTLTRRRANVHALTAGPEGVRLMDFGIKFPPSDIGPRVFSALEVDPTPVDPVRMSFDARWIGNVYAKGYQRKK